jgi:hypothetical protein
MRATTWYGAVALALTAVAASPSLADDAKPVERFTAFAVNMGGNARTSTAVVDIVIERWSSDAERDRLVAALQEDRTDGLLKALRKIEPRAGYIRTATSVGYPIRFARQIPLASGGRRLLLATDRQLSFFEISRGSRTTDYPFMIIDVRLGADGEGEGKLLPLARVTMHPDHVVEIENYNLEPVRLTKVKKAD